MGGEKGIPASTSRKEVPRGWMGIWVVGGEGETPERFVVPVGYLNHPRFLRLLEAAEEEFGFEHQGAITLPCRVDEFRQLRRLIDEHQNHLPISGRCFWV